MMRKKWFSRGIPRVRPFFFPKDTLRIPFLSSTGYLVLVFRETVPTVIYYGKLVPFLT